MRINKSSDGEKLAWWYERYVDIKYNAQACVLFTTFEGLPRRRNEQRFVLIIPLIMESELGCLKKDVHMNMIHKGCVVIIIFMAKSSLGSMKDVYLRMHNTLKQWDLPKDLLVSFERLKMTSKLFKKLGSFSEDYLHNQLKRQPLSAQTKKE